MNKFNDKFNVKNYTTLVISLCCFLLIRFKINYLYENVK